MQATRYRILEILKEQGGVTVAELAHKLDMAPVSVRHHLDVLQSENLIHCPRVRRHGTVGRPQQVYSLTPAAEQHFPSNTQKLAAVLLSEIKAILPQQEINSVFHRVADTMVGEAKPMPENATLEERADTLVSFLNERGYLARWEKRDGSILLVTLNCPYSGVAGLHRELCAMDQHIMGHLLGASPIPITRISEGACRCAYQVNSPPGDIV